MAFSLLFCLGLPASGQFNKISAGPPLSCYPKTLLLDQVNNVVYSCGAGDATHPPVPQPVDRGGAGAIVAVPSGGQFITTVSPTAVNSGFGAGNVPCSSFDTNGTTDAACALDTNPYSFMATGASSFYHAWNFRFQTDMKTADNPYGLEVNGILEIPASGQTASDSWAVGISTTVAGGHASANGTFSRALRLRSFVMGAGTVLNGAQFAATWYLPTVGAGATNNGQIGGFNCDNASVAGTNNGTFNCVSGGGSLFNTNFYSPGHVAGSGASFAVGASDPQALCSGNQGGANTAVSPATWTNVMCIGLIAGSPNGVVAEPVGSMQLDSTNGTPWVKYSGGSTNLGWLQLNPEIVASLVTTAAASDAVTMTGTTSSSHCSIAATNASAATNIATTYITKAANTITVSHAVTANMNYDLMCTPN